jgi:hypothetical protein
MLKIRVRENDNPNFESVSWFGILFLPRFVADGLRLDRLFDHFWPFLV